MMSKAQITVATLIYASPDYLKFVTDSLKSAKTNLEIDYLVVANDPWPVVRDYLKTDDWLSRNIRTVIHENPNPNEWWLDRVYNAWNRCLNEVDTPFVAFVNSDMYFCDYWLDNLAKYDLGKYVPTSRLVESQRMPSLPGLIEKNFGQTLATFKPEEFKAFAASISESNAYEGIGAFMPSLHATKLLKNIGGWRKNFCGIPGDRVTFDIYRQMYGIVPIMVCDSLAYHMQRSESIEVGDPQ